MELELAVVVEATVCAPCDVHAEHAARPPLLVLVHAVVRLRWCVQSEAALMDTGGCDLRG